MIQIVSIFDALRRQKIDRKFILGCISIALLLLVYLPLRAIETRATTAKLIEYGWDAPTPDFFRQHIKEMDKRPFDGVMLKLNAGKEIFTKTAYPSKAFTKDRQNLAATRPSRLTDNFIIVWSGTDRGWDWFNNNDWAAAEKNIQNFAKTAKAGRFRGIAFDSESYTNSPWQYHKQPQQANKTFPEYQQQVRKRGAQFMRAMQLSQPNPQVLTFGLLSWMKDLFGSSLNATQLQAKLANHGYGLWPAFINGMLDVAQPGAVIIDGHEWAYYFSSAAAFDGSRNSVLKDGRKFVEPVNYVKYDRQVKLGQSVFLDLLIDLFPKNTTTSSFPKTIPHFLSPDGGLKLLEHNIYHSLRTANRYSWMYSEHVDWWKNNIPTGVEAAIMRGKTKAQKRQPLGLNIDPLIKAALKQCQAINTVC